MMAESHLGGEWWVMAGSGGGNLPKRQRPGGPIMVRRAFNRFRSVRVCRPALPRDVNQRLFTFETTTEILFHLFTQR